MSKTYNPWILMLLMVLSAAIAWAMEPSISMANQRKETQLESLIPGGFGDWRELKQTTGQIVNPQQTAILDKIYSQTLTRTYINSQGATIMLSIAYGQDQSRDLQIHRPEVCYSAQGFQILSAKKMVIMVSNAAIPAMQLVAQQGRRNEPITYWVRIGEKIVRGNVEQGLARLTYGLNGYVPDGILFRVSSISQNNNIAFETQQSFITDLLASVPTSTKSYLLGQQSL